MSLRLSKTNYLKPYLTFPIINDFTNNLKIILREKSLRINQCVVQNVPVCVLFSTLFSISRVVKMDLTAMRIAIENCIVCLRIRIVNSMEWNDFYIRRLMLYSEIECYKIQGCVEIMYSSDLKYFSLICSGCEKWPAIWFVTTITVFFTPKIYNSVCIHCLSTPENILHG